VSSEAKEIQWVVRSQGVRSGNRVVGCSTWKVECPWIPDSWGGLFGHHSPLDHDSPVSWLKVVWMSNWVKEELGRGWMVPPTTGHLWTPSVWEYVGGPRRQPLQGHTCLRWPCKTS